MEKQFSFGLKLSLKEITLKRVVIIFWSGSDVLASIAKFPFDSCISKEFTKLWQEIVENKVKNKVSKLQLPESLSKQMIGIVKPIGLQIARWKIFHDDILGSLCAGNVPVSVFEQLVWTFAGTIDYGLTAEELIRLEMLDVIKRFKLACIYCLDNYIPNLWKELSEDSKKSFLNKDSYRMDLIELTYWICVQTGDVLKLNDILGRLGAVEFGEVSYLHQHGFIISARKGNRRATEFFFLKLTNEERDSLLFTGCAVIVERFRELSPKPKGFPEGKLSDVLFYLFSKMNVELQIQFLKQYPCEVLKSLLEWPLHDLLLDNADIVWSFIPESSYNHLRISIILKFMDSDCYFPNLFERFFLSSPNSFRKYFVDQECDFVYFFDKFFKTEDKECMKIVLRNIDAADKARLVSRYRFFCLLDEYIMMRNKWHLIEFCIQEATVSKEDRERLKETFMKFLSRSDITHVASRNRKWKKIFLFLAEADANASSNRSSEA